MLSQRYDAGLAPAGLNVRQLSILAHSARNRRSRGSLAAELGMDRSSPSRELRPLQEAGWITLAPGEEARPTRITVSASGRAAIARAMPYWSKAQAGVEQQPASQATPQLQELRDPALARVQAMR